MARQTTELDFKSLFFIRMFFSYCFSSKMMLYFFFPPNPLGLFVSLKLYFPNRMAILQDTDMCNIVSLACCDIVNISWYYLLGGCFITMVSKADGLSTMLCQHIVAKMDNSL